MKGKIFIQMMMIAVMVLGLFASSVPAGVTAKEAKILEFQTMVGVPAGLTGNLHPIHGLNGAGRPWVIGAAKGELTASGKLELRFDGLVFDPTDPGVIAAGLANRNTVANMKAVVACFTKEGGLVQVSSPVFPVTTGFVNEGGGSGKIEAQLSLPQPCIAPVVFITSQTGAWFATTGY
jgi:hypothetical protein